MFWILVMLPIAIGCLAIAGINVFKRYLLKEGNISPLQFLIGWYATVIILFGLIYLLIWGFTWPSQLLPGFWTAVVLGSCANVIIQFCNAKVASLDKGEVSFTAPLQAMTPGLITGLAVVLGEYPSKVGICGVFLMACGSYLLLWEKTPEHWWGYFGPLKRLFLLLRIGRLSPEERNKTIVVSLALFSAAMGTVGLLFDGLYTRRGVDMQGLTLASMGLVLFLLVVYIIWYATFPDNKPSQGFKHFCSKKSFVFLMAIAACWIILIFTIQPTFNHTLVAYTGTLKRFSILFSVVLGYLIFKEGDFRKRLFAAVLIILGVILISMDDLPTKISTQIEGWGI